MVLVECDNAGQIRNENRHVLGNKDQWWLARSSEATACTQSYLPSPLFYECIT